MQEYVTCVEDYQKTCDDTLVAESATKLKKLIGSQEAGGFCREIKLKGTCCAGYLVYYFSSAFYVWFIELWSILEY